MAASSTVVVPSAVTYAKRVLKEITQWVCSLNMRGAVVAEPGDGWVLECKLQTPRDTNFRFLPTYRAVVQWVNMNWVDKRTGVFGLDTSLALFVMEILACRFSVNVIVCPRKDGMCGRCSESMDFKHVPDTNDLPSCQCIPLMYIHRAFAVFMDLLLHELHRRREVYTSYLVFISGNVYRGPEAELALTFENRRRQHKFGTMASDVAVLDASVARVCQDEAIKHLTLQLYGQRV